MNLVFKALADPTRRRVLELLKEGPLSAGDLAREFQVSKPTMSAHFAVLREANLVAAQRDGKSMIYHLKMSVLEEALLAFSSGFGMELKPAKNRPGDLTAPGEAAQKLATPT